MNIFFIGFIKRMIGKLIPIIRLVFFVIRNLLYPIKENPHFLFNALGSIRSMILISKDQAWEMVSELSEFFRYTLINFNKVEGILNNEINAVKNYLNIDI